MIITQCIYDPPVGDGIRISVMSRHMQNDGVTPDSRIVAFDIHIPKLGPSPKLIGDYYKRGLSWKLFSERYAEELKRQDKAKLVALVAELAKKQNVVLLCKEKSHDFCHRSLLAEACATIFPELEIQHY